MNKLIGSFVLAAMVLQTLALPAQASSLQAATPQIFFIQDAHGNPGAQKSIAALIEKFHKENGITRVFVEGADEEASLEFFHELAPENELRKAAEKFLQDGLIQGPEYLTLSTTLPLKLTGIENRDLYFENLDTFGQVLEKKTQSLSSIARLRNAAASLQYQLLSQKSLALLKLYRNFRNGEGAFSDYLQTLLTQARENKISLLGYSELLKLQNKNLQDNLEAEKILKQAEALMAELLNLQVTDAVSRESLDFSRLVELHEKLLTLQITPAELQTLLTLKKTWPQHQDMAGWINGELLARGHCDYLVPTNTEFDATVEQALHFYSLTKKRDAIFVANILKTFNTSQESKAILVAGGYHSDNLGQLLKDAGLKIDFVSPQIEKSSNIQKYEKQIFSFLRKESPIDKTKSPALASLSTLTRPLAVMSDQSLHEISEFMNIVPQGTRLISTKKPSIYVIEPTISTYDVLARDNRMMEHAHDSGRKIDKALAVEQWKRGMRILRALGVDVHIYPQRAGVEDLVFTANAGYVHGKIFIPSRFTYENRQEEVPYNQQDLITGLGLEWKEVVPPGLRWEGEGDMLPYQGRLFGGSTFRSVGKAHRMVAEELKMPVSVLKMVYKKRYKDQWDFYHLDTCFSPMADGKTVLFYPKAFHEKSIEEIKRYVAPENLIKLTDEEARDFAANNFSFLIDGQLYVMMNHAQPRLRAILEKRGFKVIDNPMSEYLPSGGSVKCTILTLNGPGHDAPKLIVPASARGSRLAAAQTQTPPADVASEGFMDKYREEMLRRIHVDNAVRHNETVLERHNDGWTTIPDDPALDERLQLLLGHDSAFDKRVREIAAGKRVKIHLVNAAPGTPWSTHPHFLFLRGLNFALAYSDSNHGEEIGIYLTRSAFLDFHPQILVEVLQNQLVLGVARYNAWHAATADSDLFLKGSFIHVHPLLDRIIRETVYAEDLLTTTRQETALQTRYHLEKPDRERLLSAVEEITLGSPNETAPLDYLKQFNDAAEEFNYYRATYFWGLFIDALAESTMHFQVSLKKAGCPAIIEAFQNSLTAFTQHNGVWNDQGHEFGKAVGKVWVIDDSGSFAAAVKKAYDLPPSQRNIIWVVRDLPDRYAEIPGIGLIVQRDGNQHAIGVAKELKIPFAIVPHAIELLKPFHEQTGMLRVSESTHDVRFRQANPGEQSILQNRKPFKPFYPRPQTGGPLSFLGSEADPLFAGSAGTKGGNLSDVLTIKNAPFKVPPVAMLSREFYWRFMRHNQLDQKIPAILKGISLRTVEDDRGKKYNHPADEAQFEEALGQIRELYLQGEFTPELVEEVRKRLKDIGMDADQHLDRQLRFIRQNYASLFNSKPARGYLKNETPFEDIFSSPILQFAIDSEIAGVMYTADSRTFDRNVLEILASWGMGASVVSGDHSPARALVDRTSGQANIVHPLSDKKTKIGFVDSEKPFPMSRSNGNEEDLQGFSTAGFFESYPKIEGKEPGVTDPDDLILRSSIPVEQRKRPVLTPEICRQLLKAAEAIEALRHEYYPLDIEWCYKDGTVYIVQARPQIVEGLPAETGVVDNPIMATMAHADLPRLQILKAMSNAPALADADTVLREMSLDWKPTGGKSDDFPENKKIRAMRIASVHYFYRLSQDKAFVNQLDLQQVSRILSYLRQGPLAWMDTTATPKLLLAVEAIYQNTGDQKIREEIERSFTVIAAMPTKAFSHVINVPLASVLVSLGKYDEAVKKLETRSSESLRDYPGIADQILRVLARIPKESQSAMVLLKSYESANSLPEWVRFYARRLIGRKNIAAVPSERVIAAPMGARLSASTPRFAVGTGKQFEFLSFAEAEARAREAKAVRNPETLSAPFKPTDPVWTLDDTLVTAHDDAPLSLFPFWNGATRNEFSAWQRSVIEPVTPNGAESQFGLVLPFNVLFDENFKPNAIDHHEALEAISKTLERGGKSRQLVIQLYSDASIDSVRAYNVISNANEYLKKSGIRFELVLETNLAESIENMKNDRRFGLVTQGFLLEGAVPAAEQSEKFQRLGLELPKNKRTWSLLMVLMAALRPLPSSARSAGVFQRYLEPLTQADGSVFYALRLSKLFEQEIQKAHGARFALETAA